MKAKNLLLTHFSQRYPKLSSSKNMFEDDGPVIGFAYDSMRIRLSEFNRLPLLLGPLKTLWTKLEKEELENDA